MTAAPPASFEVDPREAGRVIASVLHASGAPTADEIARANAELRRLGRTPLTARDVVVSSPEELAPLIPLDLREALAPFVVEIAGRDPIRQRIAQAYLRLWNMNAPMPAAPVQTSPDAAELPKVTRVARWLVGALPRHHATTLPEEKQMNQAVYRGPSRELEVAAPVRDPLRTRVERIHAEFQDVVAAVEGVILGKRDVIERVLMAMAARGHVLLVDVPGVGKTQLCKAIAAAVGVRFGRVQFTPDLLPMDLTGGTVYEAHRSAFTFRPGPVFTNILLADEINRATPKTQSALLEVMEERTVTVDGTSHAMADPFQVLATMNPLDHDGTFALPAAQIDRFMVLLELGYPSPEDEVRVLDTHLSPDPALSRVAPAVSAAAFLEWQATVPLVHASPLVKRAAVDFANGLRRDPSAQHAVSPRATLSWMRAGQARAMLSGREFVTVEDLLDVAPDVLRHRLWVPREEVVRRLRELGGAR